MQQSTECRCKADLPASLGSRVSMQCLLQPKWECRAYYRNNDKLNDKINEKQIFLDLHDLSKLKALEIFYDFMYIDFDFS